MSLTWLRHGEKKYSNGHAPEGEHNHDPPLKENVKGKIDTLCVNIKNRYGIPNVILCSPFLRTRQTASLIKEKFETMCEKIIPIYVDDQISEFLGWNKPKGSNPDVDDYTEKFTIHRIGMEKLKDVDLRVKKHLFQINKSDNIVIITHGIVINYIYQNMVHQKLGRVKELSGINLRNKSVEKFVF